MPAAVATLLILGLQSQTPQQAFDVLRDAVGAGNPQRVRALFRNPGDADYLIAMANRQGGLRGMGLKVVPAPPGWGALGDHWAVFHTFQDIQQDHDVVHPLVRTPAGFRLGPEVAEWGPQAARIKHARLDTHLRPEENRIDVKARLDLAVSGLKKALVFRLNDPYRLSSALVDGKRTTVTVAGEDTIPQPKDGDVVRAGGLLIYWSHSSPDRLEAHYSGTINTSSHDKIVPSVAYVTANWVPSIGRLPHTTATRIVGPAEWVLRSEGVEVGTEAAGFPPPVDTPGLKTVQYKCDLPISFPKVIGGLYTLAAELKVGEKTYRSWHLGANVDGTRGQRDVRLMADAIEFFEKHFGPFPFPGYECFDSDTYYGIESYSYTLLQRGITTRFVAHEIGHTYFGGMAPSTYTKDTWNEGVTQYVDSVLFQNNRDRTLQSGRGTVGVKLPLSEMGVAWDNGNASYTRGAYVMKMLENEIGLEAVHSALKSIVTERRGRETYWPDLRQYFEKISGKKLEWFWNQWVTNGTFPTIEATHANTIPIENKFRTRVVVRQVGTPSPFRLRFAVRLARGPQIEEKVVTMDSPQAVFSIDTDWEPREASIEVLPYALARTNQGVAVRR